MNDKENQVGVYIEVKLPPYSKLKLREKISSYYFGTEFNIAVVVLAFSLSNDYNDIGIIVEPQVHYIVPFISEELARKYCEELDRINKLYMVLKIIGGKASLQTDQYNELQNNIAYIYREYKFV